MERRISLEAGAIEAGILAMERVHDVDNQLILAQSRLSDITSVFSREKKHPIRILGLAAGGHVDQAHLLVKKLVRRSKMRDLQKGSVNLLELLSDVKKNYEEQAKNIRVRISVTCPERLIISADLRRLFW